MPPKKRVTKADIIDTAFQIVKSEGVDTLNARNIAKALGCSTQPVFYEFKTMDELKREVLQKAGMYFLEYINQSIVANDQLLSFGIAFVEFVQKERYLYQLIFMSGALNEFNILEVCEGNNDLVNNIAKLYNLKRNNAEKVFIQLTLYVQGIASVLYSNNEAFQSDSLIKQYLKDACTGFLKVYGEEEQ